MQLVLSTVSFNRIPAFANSMAFDAERYDREVIKPLRGRHGRLPAGDLLLRYAVEPGWTAEQLAVHLKQLRQFWQDRAVGPDSRAGICQLLIQADEELSRNVGDLMSDPGWWQEQAATTQGGAGRTTRTRPPDLARTEPARHAEPPTEVPDVASGWRTEARDFIRARLDESSAAGARESTRPAARRGRVAESGGSAEAVPQVPGGMSDAVAATRQAGQRPNPETLARPVQPAELTIEALGARDGNCQVQVSWSAADAERLRIRWAETPPPWASGSVLPVATLTAFGTELAGTRQVHDGEATLLAEVPVGYHLYVPYVVDRDQAVVGRFVALGLAEPVRRLRAERRGDDVIVTWVWPEGSRLAIVEWTAPGGVRQDQITRAGYAGSNGFRIPAALDPGMARVSVLTAVAADEARSRGREVELPPRSIPVSYTLTRHRLWRFGRRDLAVRLRAETDLADLVVTVVLGTDLAMPPSAAHGTVLAEHEGVDLVAHQARELTIPVPVLPRRQDPYWIRCFLRGPVPTVVTGPPVESMRLT
ncbi:hypothetical protein [Micromonospora sp. NPDC048898]|uniref:hypothetical protein n=1 Tax=Micromonospora sp. NPDC048898 TaxID=3364260 RepID=UPI00371D628D